MDDGSVGICGKVCQTDGDCPGTTKCCSNICRSVCVEQAPEEPTGKCHTYKLEGTVHFTPLTQFV